MKVCTFVASSSIESWINCHKKALWWWKYVHFLSSEECNSLTDKSTRSCLLTYNKITVDYRFQSFLRGPLNMRQETKHVILLVQWHINWQTLRFKQRCYRRVWRCGAAQAVRDVSKHLSVDLNLKISIWRSGDRVSQINRKNQLHALISLIYFRNKTLHVSDSSSVHHQEFFTVHTAIHTGLLTAWEQDQDGTPWSCSLAFGIKLYMFRTVPLSIIRSFSLYTQQYIQVCWQLASGIRTERPHPAR